MSHQQCRDHEGEVRANAQRRRQVREPSGGLDQHERPEPEQRDDVRVPGFEEVLEEASLVPGFSDVREVVADHREMAKFVLQEPRRRREHEEDDQDDGSAARGTIEPGRNSRDSAVRSGLVAGGRFHVDASRVCGPWPRNPSIADRHGIGNVAAGGPSARSPGLLEHRHRLLAGPFGGRLAAEHRGQFVTRSGSSSGVIVVRVRPRSVCLRMTHWRRA